MYDPWVVDSFLSILDRLERAEQLLPKGSDAEGDEPLGLAPAQLEVISATTAEDREFNELRRELPKATSFIASAEILLRHLRRVVPAANFTFFVLKQDTNELCPIVSLGVGSSAIEALRIQVGDRISGWAAAHRQVVVNSNAALELGPVAKTFSVPLRYALAVPIVGGNGSSLAVLSVYGSEPFEYDHRRMLESAATLFMASTGSFGSSVASEYVGASTSEADSRIH
jgi:putative methionine-R-sulfoxide reductase with GAF domain